MAPGRDGAAVPDLREGEREEHRGVQHAQEGRQGARRRAGLAAGARPPGRRHPRDPGSPALHCRDHRRARRPDDPSAGGDRDLDRPPGTARPRGGHTPDNSHPAAVGERHNGSHQGQPPLANRLPGRVAGGFAHDLRHQGRGDPDRQGRHALFRRLGRRGWSAPRAHLSARTRSTRSSNFSSATARPSSRTRSSSRSTAHRATRTRRTGTRRTRKWAATRSCIQGRSMS